MEPVQLQNTLVCSQLTLGIDTPGVELTSVERSDTRCVQGTSKAIGSEKGGTYLHSDPVMENAPRWQTKPEPQYQVSTIEECASQLHDLQERVAFLELYVDALRSQLLADQPISSPERKLTTLDVKHLLELMPSPIEIPTSKEK
ncbi:MAG: hypothetical protein LKM36_10180 [Flavobacteriales bacterium]|jgi:hypothetical protein|nr:hypothetical protein [Flavobacteriales bacterium]MBP9161509.1 hypothetical protein [Flavobacteriales bacterium]MCI1753207.1 hypothetical protein [Flavobacteriales bacterium]